VSEDCTISLEDALAAAVDPASSREESSPSSEYGRGFDMGWRQAMKYAIRLADERKSRGPVVTWRGEEMSAEDALWSEQSCHGDYDNDVMRDAYRGGIRHALDTLKIPAPWKKEGAP